MISDLTLIVLRKELFYCNKDHLVLGKLNCMFFSLIFSIKVKIRSENMLAMVPWFKNSNLMMTWLCKVQIFKLIYHVKQIFSFYLYFLLKIKEKTIKLNFLRTKMSFFIQKYSNSLDISVSTEISICPKFCCMTAPVVS